MNEEDAYRLLFGIETQKRIMQNVLSQNSKLIS